MVVVVVVRVDVVTLDVPLLVLSLVFTSSDWYGMNLSGSLTCSEILASIAGRGLRFSLVGCEKTKKTRSLLI